MMDAASEKSTLTQIAGIIRIITVPPVMIGILLLYMYFFTPELFLEKYAFGAAFLGLVILPLLAYPVHRAIPTLHKKGRDAQRKLAFLFTVAGYTGLVLFAFLTRETDAYRIIALTYFLSVLLLIFLNKVLHIKASGHGAGATGALVFFVLYRGALYQGTVAILPCALLLLVTLWASVRKKRHTVPQYLAGVGSALLSFAVSYLLITPA